MFKEIVKAENKSDSAHRASRVRSQCSHCDLHPPPRVEQGSRPRTSTTLKPIKTHA